MGAVDLFTGISVVIDDEIGKKGANINNLIDQIEKNNVPCVKFTEIPDDETIEHFKGISFLLLDWQLEKEIDTEIVVEGVKTQQTKKTFDTKENIDFLKKLRETCFIPVFIFTNLSVDTVLAPLRKNGLYRDDGHNYIFVKNKSELKGKYRLFKEIEIWVNKRPSLYVLKTWEKVYQKAKKDLFYDFHDINPDWPKILWESFSDDGVNKSLQLGDLISKNLHTRMSPVEFADKSLEEKGGIVSRDELRKVIGGERFIKNSGLHDEAIGTGDFFKISSKIYLNIRPDCDCIPDRKIQPSKLDDVELYLLRGSKLSLAKEQKDFNEDYGQFNEPHNQAMVFSMIDGKSYCFQFKDLIKKTWSELKNNRIGRLLPPHIIRIQQKYALFLQRQGLPRTPELAVLLKEATNVTNTTGAKKKAAEKKTIKKTSKTVSKK